MIRRSVVIGTAGHIDHGKSTLVRALTGTDPDRLKEERRRGMTIDLGFAHLEIDDTVLSLVDVPGHERFVRNMLAGAGGIDLVMLVIAANESVMPQTREHFDICRLLQVPAGVIVLTKTDLADREMEELAAREARELTAGSFLADAPLLQVSSATGAGLDTLRSALAELARRLPPRTVDRPARLPVDRVFTLKGFGTVVTGTLVAGRLQEGDKLRVLPRDLAVTLRGLHVHGSSRSAAVAGERVALNLAAIEVADLARGDTIAASQSAEITRRLDAVVELLPGAPPLRHATRVRFHQGTTEVMGRVAVAGARPDDRPLDEIAPGGSAYVRLRLEAPVVLTRGDRFIIRSYSPQVTIGGGMVLDPLPPRGAVRTVSGRRRFRALDVDAAEAAQVVATMVAERGAAGLPRGALISRIGLSVARADEIVGGLCKGGGVVAIENRLLPASVLDGLTHALVEAIQQHHRDHPLADGLPRQEARERLFGRAAPGAFEQVVDRLVAGRQIAGRERLALSGHQASLTGLELTTFDAIEAAFRAAQLLPPDLPAVVAQSGLRPDVAERMVTLLVRRNRIVRVGGIYFHREALDELKREVRAMKGGGVAVVDVGMFKDRYGLSRKFAIPLLEYLDRERVTRRAGTGRVIL